ncbi:snRNA-activating protein complex subunit 3 [Asbolus verrucosus]|uniref:snRNA-activating protein complex subunit 3 n=1 Tax=Asbolus verrucosus TaxID=1661398 RepID=A0A482WDY3_ASBVE|nr:snRNA-activating protein complex subunit 3 [Asbolus verrucosus]
MEEIYPPENYSASIRFPLKGYFDEFNNMFSPKIPFPVFSCDEPNEVQYLLAVKDLMEVDMDLNDLKYLSESCSTDHLTCEGENTKDFPIEVPENLNSSSKLPVAFFTSNEPSQLEFAIPSTPSDLKPGSDFILSILIYRPFAFKYFNAKNASEKLRFNHEIVALGRNTLAELRDTIICSSDDGLCKEVQSTSDNLKPLANAKNKFPSGFIFIDNVFYNDFRSSKALDYSLPILEWTKEKNIQNLQSKSIENVPLSSLTPRFGYPYLYMHQGDCEHLLVFADAKLLDNDDCLHSQCYPHVLKLNRKANKMCFMCTVSFAKWICIDSDRLPQNKVFMCTECCKAYNYIDGEKIGNFKLYPYYEKHVVT